MPIRSHGDFPPAATFRNRKLAVRYLMSVWICLQVGIVDGQGLAELQRPIAVVATGQGNLVVANRDTGRLASIKVQNSTGKHRVTFSDPIARRISDMAKLNDDCLLVADSGADELLVVAHNLGRFDVVERFPVDKSPVRIAVSPDKRTVSVACLWAQRVTLFKFAKSTPLQSIPELKQESSLDLEFSPREMLFVSDTELIIGDSFGSTLAVTSTGSPPAIQTLAQIPAHNIRGLAIEPKTGRLLVAHQLINGFLPNSRDHVFWGNVMTNLMRFIDLDQLRSIGTQKSKIHGAIYPLGEERNAAGDPGRTIATRTGYVVSLFTGVHQIGIRRPGNREFRRVTVGRGPIAICEIPTGETKRSLAAVVNKFDDSVSIVDLDQSRVVETITLNKGVAKSRANRGEELFYDASVSLDGWFSCHSCHTDGHSCGQLNDNLSDHSFGTPKRILSLLGVGQTGPWAWNGSQHLLDDQIRKSMDSTMRGTEQRQILENDVKAISAYLKTLSYAPGVDVARNHRSELIEAGRAIFESNNCADCHEGENLSASETRDAGLADEPGLQLNPPTLRGVSQRQAWLHDGRATTLRAVFEDADHQRIGSWSTRDLDALVAYLRTL